MKVLIQISSLLIIMCVSFLGSAQAIRVKKEPYAAYPAIKILKDGVLIVYLKTNHRKISVLQQLVKDHPRNKRYQKFLNEAIKERDNLQKATVRAYDNFYSFSSVLFMPDTSAKKLFAGRMSGIFVDETLKIDTTLRIKKDQSFLISFIGGTDTQTTTGKKSLLVGDHTGQTIPAPFPYVARLYDLGDILISKSEALVIRKAVRRQQKKFDKFYKKYHAKMGNGELMTKEDEDKVGELMTKEDQDKVDELMNKKNKQ